MLEVTVHILCFTAMTLNSETTLILTNVVIKIHI